MNIFSIDPIAFHLFSKPVYWYGIIISTTIFIAYYLAEKEAIKRGLKNDTMLDLLLVALPISLITARLYYVVFRWDYYSKHKNEIIAIWDGGIAIYGGLLGGIATLYYFSKKRDLNILKMLDIIAPSLLVGQMLGRWGNFFNQEAYGGEVSRKFLEDLFIPEFIINNMYIDGLYRHPTFLYESIWCLVAFIVVVSIRKHLYLGEVLSTYLILYGAERFVVEGMRTDSLYIGMFKVSQLVSILMLIIGVSIFIKSRFFNKDKIKYINS
ncbi:prolipoprotein diacylglyceryl transferase [Gemelliphila palaticanis]|uniref:Phosphatidylglycerol--prolipoprotein diacylglyceryl transferase n=1 Tax=Gemelliphila palaticanis TaxID=81950 RepID=A0ABX2T0N8_9BACL|nr:prolipoprotein diacylglyceryl transferase [Gemella palaticanis]MBF0715273.1 prolipoprotein diacylglyceryl transferase [Gemella palaticanis]NYS47203.1 prolipoprotein diacylglyceryl transferase [Gemella palaticanis]